ncbi:hypothetical protein Tco_0830835, partial [Tanacetum coccineum]
VDSGARNTCRIRGLLRDIAKSLSKIIGEENEIKPIPTMPNPNPIKSDSPIVSPFLKDCTVHIPYTNTKTFVDNVLPNHVGDEEFKSIGGIGMLTKKKIKKDDIGMPKELNKE